MKSLIAHQLPKKTDRVVFCQLTEAQRAAYERFLASDWVETVRTAYERCDCKSGKSRGICCYNKSEDGTKWQVSSLYMTPWTLSKSLVGTGVSPYDHTAEVIKPLSIAHTKRFGSVGKTGASFGFPSANDTGPLERAVWQSRFVTKPGKSRILREGSLPKKIY